MGSGPGGHPGVTIVKLTSDTAAVTQAIEVALDGNREFKFKYQTEDGKEYAVFASKY